MSGISIIIPTYNRESFLGPTLESVKAMHVPEGTSVEVLVIDNNCTDDTARVIERAQDGAPFRIRRILETQQGLCFARNRGLAEASGEYLGYLDDDIFISPDWIASFLEAIDVFQADVLVGPVFPVFDGEPPEFLTGRAMDIISSHYSRRGEVPLIVPSQSQHELPGCNFGVRRGLALQVGGFNTILDRIGKQLLAGGDSDFGLRLKTQNARVVYHPGCWVKHVIIAEKLTRSYLRSRAYGLGVTSRKLQSIWSHPSRIRRNLRAAGRHALNMFAQRMRGDSHNAFSEQLRMLQALGYLKGQ